MSDARSALAKVLTSSVSRGAMVRRLKKSAAIPKSGSGPTLTPETHGCFDDGGVWAQPESVPSSSLPTQPEWEEPVHRVAMTTFKVIPSKPTGSDPGPGIEVEGEPAVEGSPDPGTDGQTQTEEDPLCPSSLEGCSQEGPGSDRLPPLPPSPGSVCHDSPPTEEEEDEPEVTPEVVPVESSECDDVEALEVQIESAEQREVPQSSTQSGSTDVHQGGPDAGETEVEGEVLQDEAVDDAFPPPPSPVFFIEDTNILSEVEEVPQAFCLPSSSQTSSPTSPDPDGVIGEDVQVASQLPKLAPEPLEKRDVAPSRFAEAVAMAVQKSHLQRQRKVLGLRASRGPPSDV